MDKKEFALVATWVLVLIFALSVPQCTRNNAMRANEVYKEKLEQNKAELQSLDK